MDLARLVEIDELQSINLKDGLPTYIHKDHRFCLPLLFKHQNTGGLPNPCDLILFDRHRDMLPPRSIDKLTTMRQNAFTESDLIALCEEDLAKKDDDWIIAGMELGLIQDVVVFGVEDVPKRMGKYHTDHLGVEHRIVIQCCTPGELLGYQGDLCDLAKRDQLTDLWDILQWEFISGQGFRFKGNRHKVWLNIDLDCFVVAMKWKQWDFIFPWADEAFNDFFFKPSDYLLTEGWTGKRFFSELRASAGLLTIAKEPDYCGGQAKMEEVFDKVNRHLFDGDLGNLQEQQER
jgi:hypothetical protein